MDEKHRKYFEEIAAALKKHGLLQSAEFENLGHEEIRGLRALIFALRDPRLSWATYTDLAIQSIIERAKQDPEFAKKIHALAKRYGRELPTRPTPEQYLESAAEVSLGTISPERLPERPPKNKMGRIKWQLKRDVEALTRATYRESPRRP